MLAILPTPFFPFLMLFFGVDLYQILDGVMTISWRQFVELLVALRRFRIWMCHSVSLQTRLELSRRGEFLAIRSPYP